LYGAGKIPGICRRSRILKLYQILHEQTDEHHSLATPDLVALLAECENARLKEIMQRIRETPCALTEYDDLLVRQIVERVTVDSKEQLTVSFGQGVDIQVQIP